MSEPLAPSEGWAVLHLFCKARAGADAEAIRIALKSAAEGDHQVVTFAVLGHKADLGVMAIGPDVWRHRRLQTALQQAGLEVVASYVSMTEVSEYAKGMPQEMLDARLYPQVDFPGKRAICFYPMSKKRDVGANWFTLPFDERKEHMLAHGKSGRSFAGRVFQLITGSTGVDDFEWGVTLWANHPDDLKAVVYTMRFDEVSAVYAEFGPFYTGIVGPPDEILEGIGLT